MSIDGSADAQAGVPPGEAGAPVTPGLDVARFEAWLRRTCPELAGPGPLSAALLTGGRSNVTYRVDGGRLPMVLRRPPLGHVQATAHDMAREHRVISALEHSPVPVPRALALHDDSDGTAGVGSPFFLMTRMPGQALAVREQNAGYPPAGLHAISLELARLLAELHRLDPVGVGLDDFGRADGYLARQIRRWGLQYDGSRSRELPRLDRLQDRLRTRIPEQSRAGLVHGDFRLDNALVHTPVPAAMPRISAILDWELSSLGDTGVDVGLLWLSWELSAVIPRGAVSAVDPAAGYPPFGELLEAYCDVLGQSVPQLAWYRAFATYKLAVIIEGVYFRHRSGDTVGTGFDGIGELAEPLAADGLAHLARAVD